jgi:hypothetical protein
MAEMKPFVDKTIDSLGNRRPQRAIKVQVDSLEMPSLSYRPLNDILAAVGRLTGVVF